MKIGPHQPGSGGGLPRLAWHAVTPIDRTDFCPPTAKQDCPPGFCPPTAKSKTDIDRFETPRFRRSPDAITPAHHERLSLFGAADPLPGHSHTCAGAGGSAHPGYGPRPVGELPPPTPPAPLPPPPYRPEAYPVPTNLGSLIDVLV